MDALPSFSVAVEGLMGGHSGINIQEVSVWLDADRFSSTVSTSDILLFWPVRFRSWLAGPFVSVVTDVPYMADVRRLLRLPC